MSKKMNIKLQIRKIEELKIFCYRDNLEGEKYRYFGVTLYFIEGQKNIIRVKPERLSDVTLAIEKLFDADNIIIGFVRDCIDAGIRKTKCYNNARSAGIAIRKQNQLALYDYLTIHPETPDDEEVYAEIKANDQIYELVQDHFAEQLSMYMGGMMYERSGLSECDAPTEIEPGDFVFEIGRLQSARITYYGHYRRGRWLDLNIFDDFNLSELEVLLRAR